MQSALDPQSQAAGEIATLWWGMLAAGGLILAVVTILLIVSVWRTRRRGQPLSSRNAWTLVVGGGIVTPAVVIIAMVVVGVVLSGRMATVPQGALTIEVSGKQWWWEIRYLDKDGETTAVTANEMHIPTGEVVRLRLLSDNVIHSFWVPSLQGKTDLIPGQENESWVSADKPGVYRGQCSEFCGTQHTFMGFTVVASERDEFDTWLENHAAPAAPPSEGSGAEGRRVFAEVGCGGCHTVRGTDARGAFGPDLTHLATRGHLAAATIPNTRENLRAWVTDPQSIKPGSKMPSTEFEAGQLDELLDYLESLT